MVKKVGRTTWAGKDEASANYLNRCKNLMGSMTWVWDSSLKFKIL